MAKHIKRIFRRRGTQQTVKRTWPKYLSYIAHSHPKNVEKLVKSLGVKSAENLAAVLSLRKASDVLIYIPAETIVSNLRFVRRMTSDPLTAKVFASAAKNSPEETKICIRFGLLEADKVQVLVAGQGAENVGKMITRLGVRNTRKVFSQLSKSQVAKHFWDIAFREGPFKEQKSLSKILQLIKQKR